MTEKEYAFALNSTLNEIKNVCPDISHSFIFGEGAKIIAKDTETDQRNATKAAETLKKIIEKADAIGGIESITFQSEKSNVNLCCTGEFCTTMVASSESDGQYLNNLSQVLVPTTLKLVEEIKGYYVSENLIEPEKTEAAYQDLDDEEKVEVDEPVEEDLPKEETVSIADEVETDVFIPEPTATQFLIENIGGLLVSSDTVQIDNEVILQWKETYEDIKITEVEIETLSGQTTRCKFKPIKDEKHSGKGVIRMPKKIQLELQASKGELITVKPVVK